MKKIVSLSLFFICVVFVLFNSIEIIESIRLSFKICINNLFPSLIPFMILSNILINYNFINDLSEIFKNLMKMFKINKNCSFALIMSLISGTPSNAKYLKDLYDNKLIDENDVRKCLNFCHFTNPIFILGTIGFTFLNDKKLGLIILVSHYLGSIIIGLFQNKSLSNEIEYNNNLKDNNKSFINILSDSIYSTINTLLLILGIITFCLIISCILNKIFSLNDNLKFIYGFIEITQGLNYLKETNMSIDLKAIISSFIISFGGVCIHAQVFSIIDNKKIKYYPYLIARIIHAFISATLTAIFIMLFH